jgi:hypothetical protein
MVFIQPMTCVYDEPGGGDTPDGEIPVMVGHSE